MLLPYLTWDFIGTYSNDLFSQTARPNLIKLHNNNLKLVVLVQNYKKTIWVTCISRSRGQKCN